MIEEIWRSIKGYEGLYEVSSYGRVRSLDRYDSSNHFRKGKLLKLKKENNGYIRITLCKCGIEKMYMVHRLVANEFIDNPYKLPQINHKDENPTNNRVDNLEWCNQEYNNKYGLRLKRIRNINVKNGLWTGLSKKEYNKKWVEENRDKYLNYQRIYNSTVRKKRIGL